MSSLKWDSTRELFHFVSILVASYRKYVKLTCEQQLSVDDLLDSCNVSKSAAALTRVSLTSDPALFIGLLRLLQLFPGNILVHCCRSGPQQPEETTDSDAVNPWSVSGWSEGFRREALLIPGVDRKVWAQSQESTLGNSTLLSENWFYIWFILGFYWSSSRTVQSLVLNIQYKLLTAQYKYTSEVINENTNLSNSWAGAAWTLYHKPGGGLFNLKVQTRTWGVPRTVAAGSYSCRVWRKSSPWTPTSIRNILMCVWRKMFPVSKDSELWTTSSFPCFFFWWSLKLNVGWASSWGVSVSCEETFNVHVFIISDTELLPFSTRSETTWRSDPPVQRHVAPPLRLLCSLYYEQHAAANAYLIRWGGYCDFASVGLSLIIATEAQQLPRWNHPSLQDQPSPRNNTGTPHPPTPSTHGEELWQLHSCHTASL